MGEEFYSKILKTLRKAGEMNFKAQVNILQCRTPVKPLEVSRTGSLEQQIKNLKISRNTKYQNESNT